MEMTANLECSVCLEYVEVNLNELGILNLVKSIAAKIEAECCCDCCDKFFLHVFPP